MNESIERKIDKINDKLDLFIAQHSRLDERVKRSEMDISEIRLDIKEQKIETTNSLKGFKTAVIGLTVSLVVAVVSAVLRVALG